ncbi:hypothetical protein IEC97_20875 [Neobacillus cucumis]|uniref:hypothetical protein n=1 Tax=Neobacillus cucumis TaxID=1740721 RepID=UPI0018E02D6B|nr:hypothetical protein [Neobacillus cucumis]MBI0579816.1 hypothetical protein [Neobacillus cucumis]
MNLKSGQIQQFAVYSQFKNLKEFNNHMEMWLVEHKQEFTKGELVGLKRLVRFSAKIPGVCNAKIGTMLKAIHEEYHDHGISRSTFKRMIQKSIKLGILTVIETERKNGSQSSNLYLFNRFAQNEPPKQQELNHPNKTSNLSETKIQEINKRKEETFDLDYSFTNDRVPKPFVQLVKYFFDEAKTIEEFWRMTQIAAYRGNREKEKDRVLEVAIKSFKQLISKLKSSQKIQKPISYFYGILEKKFDELYYAEIYEMWVSQPNG